MGAQKFIDTVEDIVKNLLEKMGLLTNEWHLGVVESVQEDGKLSVYVNGSDTATPSVPCNPDITFEPGDHVWVHFVNRRPNHLFVPYKRQV